MLYLAGNEEIKETEYYMHLAAKEAIKSTCKKSQRGAIIVKKGKILGRGHNKVTLEKLCNPCIRETITDNSRVELCSAIHAEQMAIIEAVRKSESLAGARMYCIKIKKGKPQPSGEPSCTVCSRLIYELGIEFVLWHKEGYVVYAPRELNELSFKYFLGK